MTCIHAAWARRPLLPLRVAGLAILLLWSTGTDAAANADGVPDNGILDFAILRNGSAIGQYVVRFERDGETLQVAVEASVDYRFGFIPLYRFDLRATEVWRDGRMLQMTALTRDNGTTYAVEAHSQGEAFLLKVNEDEAVVSSEAFPASLWNPATVGRKLLLDPADGELMSVTVAEAGVETIRVRGRDVSARRYTMTGDFERDLWFDASGVLLQVRFRGDDGSEIRYGLR